MKKLVMICAVVMVMVVGSTNAALVDNGGGFIYDTDLNITWYDATHVSINWTDAVDWAAGLTAGGVTGWRLPSSVDLYDGHTPSMYNNTASEMGHLFYTELGNKGLYDTSGNERTDFYDINGEIVVQNASPFNDLKLGDVWTWAIYWGGTESTSAGAWAFNTSYGQQENYAKADPDYYAIAVHAGNVIPEPATMALLGLGGLLLRRKK